MKTLAGSALILGAAVCLSASASAQPTVVALAVEDLQGGQYGWVPWSFGERSGVAHAATPGAVPAEEQPASTSQAAAPANAELEVLFWQSIVNSTDPADFEAYLGQFPNGVFRRLAELRLSALRASGGVAIESASPAAGGAGLSGAPDPVFRSDRTCAGQSGGASCWKEVFEQPGCYVWVDGPVVDRTTAAIWVGAGFPVDAMVTWTGECEGGLAQGTGELTWAGSDYDLVVESGRMEDGGRQGPWVIHAATGVVEEGPYVDDRRHGRWILRDMLGAVEEGSYIDDRRQGHWVERGGALVELVEEGPYVDGVRNGRWVIRYEREVHEGPYVDGEKNGHWVIRYESGNMLEGPYVDDRRNGHWVERDAVGDVREGSYVNGRRNGHWVIRYANGTIAEGSYVGGRRNGRWVERFPSGDVQEGPYIDDEKHGDWDVQWAVGGTGVVRWVNGERRQ